ncbi:ABC transporter permease [Paenibacillus sp. FSL H8-0548]|uniref:ABC transporter permease n=1 Tax=Paenibacillus sp. FSL H8-0548 TaxID=1920422 RepID=UPI0015C366C7|nr:ABC transporter permease [Paenibacillus sp. FSL H8-0548]
MSALLKKWSYIPWQVRLSMILVIFLFIVIVFADWIMPYNPNSTKLLDNNTPPVFLNGSWEHVLGTDQLGRDLMSRIIYGMKTSFSIAAVGLVIGCIVGVAAGLISGYVGGWVDKLIMALVDFQFAVPYTLILLMGIVIFGTDTIVLIILIGLANWENYARVVRGLVLSLRENQYIEAAQTSGGSALYIMTKHIFPNILPTILVMMTLYFPSVLTMESSLSFLGIGIQPPTASLGRMVGEGRNYLMTSWWISIVPSLLIVLMAMLMQTIGDWFRDRMNISNNME